MEKTISEFLPKTETINQLDLATGTGDIPIMMLDTKNGKKIKHVTGLDISTEMIKVGKEKLRKKKLEHKIELIEGDATEIQVNDNTKELVTIAFGIRNVSCVDKALNEMQRVLKEGGRALILEFSLPNNKLIKSGYLFYFRYILPIIGGLITGDYAALKYLNKSVEAFPYGEDFLKKMRIAGFKHTKANKLCFGVATIYQGDA